MLAVGNILKYCNTILTFVIPTPTTKTLFGLTVFVVEAAIFCDVRNLPITNYFQTFVVFMRCPH